MTSQAQDTGKEGTPSRLSRRRLLAWLPGSVGCLCCSAAFARELLPTSALPGEAFEAEPTRDEGGLGNETAQLKVRHFDADYDEDFYLVEDRRKLLRTVSDHLRRCRDFIGFGHFNIIGFDELLRLGVRFGEIGAFNRLEIELIDELFYADARRYGFLGSRVSSELSARPKKQDLKKIEDGHYLYRGPSVETYQRLVHDLEHTLVLTSGVRGIVKQLQLFLEKADANGGNLSRASRSLAPPGYSYHAVGDFDVGRPGFGLEDFTESFAQTPEYQRMKDLGYATTRYSTSNPFGVRYEPWHIKVG